MYIYIYSIGMGGRGNTIIEEATNPQDILYGHKIASKATEINKNTKQESLYHTIPGSCACAQYPFRPFFRTMPPRPGLSDEPHHRRPGHGRLEEVNFQIRKVEGVEVAF